MPRADWLAAAVFDNAHLNEVAMKERAKVVGDKLTETELRQISEDATDRAELLGRVKTALIASEDTNLTEGQRQIAEAQFKKLIKEYVGLRKND